MRVAVIGAEGQVGADTVAAFEQCGDIVYTLRHADIEISDMGSVSRVLEQLQPELIVNTAAMHHVESCEREPVRAFEVNSIGARNLAVAARSLDAALMHISTDYVFDGKKNIPYTESDGPAPLNAYGITKLAGEHFIRATTEKHFVLRTSALYGTSPCRAKGGLNFVELMLKLAHERGEVKVVDSETVSPTSTVELAQQMVQLSRSQSYGLYHATAEGSCSWYEFAREIFSLTNTLVRLKAAGPNEFPAKVPRPAYSVLENVGLKSLGLNTFKPWREGLNSYLAERVVREPLQVANSDSALRAGIPV
jgi:dTDP-4-dehydrorhamnose reductase